MVALGGLLVTAVAAGLPFAQANPRQPRHKPSSGNEARHPHPHNKNHPHRALMHRSITNSAADVSGRSFDFVIAGGGVAGLALAARLSEWSNVTVLVVEAGGDGNDVADQIDIPGYSYLRSLTGSAYDWAYNTVPQVDSLGGARYWPRGKGLGGSGAINGLYWGRGDQKEYDAWATLNPDGAQTWNWAEMSKYINKAENFTAPSAAVQRQFGMVYDPSVHGQSGAIHSTVSQYIFDGVKNWIPTWVNLGFTAKDLAGGSTNGVTISTSTINPTNQTRSDSKAGYIDPMPPRANLVILTGQQVTQIIYNGSTDASGNVIASGVRFQANAGAQSYSVQANKEVILAGGTVGSPQILQLSGIGPQSVLSPLGIPSKVDLPVGYNLQDHVSYSMYWSTPQGTLTWANLSNSGALQASELTKWRNGGTGMWTFINEAVGYPSMNDMLGASSSNTYASTVQSALSATVSQVTSWQNLPSTVSTGLAAQYAIQQQWLSQNVGQLEIILTMLGNGGNTVGIQVALQHAWSRGTIFINSTNAFVQPNINPDYFGVGYDIDIMNAGSEFARKLADTAPLNTLMINEVAPGAAITEYDAMANYTKEKSGTEYHPLGTCAMLPRASGGVVDTNLIVYGTNNIRVIDASIMPLHLSAHLMASTYGIAEKGADIIKAKYMFQQPASPNTSTGAGAGAGGAQTGTASAGVATDPAVTGANSLAGQSAGNMSSGTKIGIGLGVALGAAALLGALIVFCCLRRRKNKNAAAGVDATNPRGWYNDDPAFAAQNARGPPGGGGYSDAAVPMSNLAAPVAPYAAAPSHQRKHSNTPSVDTIATTEMASRMPLANRDSGYNLVAGADEHSRPHTPAGMQPAMPPNRASGEFGSGHFGYPASPTQGSWGQQKYTPVNIS